MLDPHAIAKLVDALEHQYELAGVASALPLGGEESGRCFQVICESGVFVARRYRHNAVMQVELGIDFLRFAESAKFALAPYLVLTKNGKGYFEHEGNLWWLTKFIEGESSPSWKENPITPALCQGAGSALRQLHQQLILFGKSTTKQSTIPSPLSMSLATGFGQAFPDPEWQVLKRTLHQCLRLTADAGLPAQLVHGDYHPANLVWHEHIPVAILDLEYMRFEPAIFDIAYGGLTFCRSRRSAEAANIDLDLLRRFLSGYGYEFSPLLVPYMVISACLCALWTIGETDERLPEDAKRFLELGLDLTGLLKEDCAKIMGTEMGS